MLRMLLDEHLSPVIVQIAAGVCPDLEIHSLQVWRDGSLRNRPDEVVLRTALDAGLTLVTYDQRTIRPLLCEMSLRGESHAGVVFLSRKTFFMNHHRVITAALADLWDHRGDADWTNRVEYLQAIALASRT